jgi:1-deoxy-D-xylulose-5-phosphate synthase
VKSVLERVNGIRDVQALSVPELGQLCEEVRQLIIDTVSRTGGHLAANLGVVELTAALLKVFDPPADKILWDVSHQTYAYKILTDRKARFETLRQYGGISGFLKRDESPFDAFGAGHSGTALSAALGMAVARDRRGGREHVVAVVGDAATSCGSSQEALNNLAVTTPRMIVILNDNEMSISANVGSMARYLGSLLSNPRYNRWKSSVESVATRMHLGWLRRIYYKIEESIKSIFLRSVIFEEMGLRYVGPIDGHNLHALIDALSIARESEKPILLHVSTQKGRGYTYAEELPEKWHGTAAFDVDSGESLHTAELPTYSAVFGQTLERLAAQDSRVVAITAAMAGGTGLAGFAKRFPRQFHDVGICEEHAVAFAAGLAAEGMRPFFVVYSTFFQRSIDFMIHDVCLQRLPVVVCLDRAGIVGDDGPTHHGVFDLSLLRSVPDLVLMQPRNEPELANMLYTAWRLGRPVVIRYPRGVGAGAPVGSSFEEIPLGRAEVLSEGTDVRLWALGDMVPVAEKMVPLLQAGGLSAGVVNARFVRPLDRDRLMRQADARLVATLENGMARGGFGSEVEEALVESGFRGRVMRFGWPDEFVPHGASSILLDRYGLTPDSMARAIRDALARGENKTETRTSRESPHGL